MTEGRERLSVQLEAAAVRAIFATYTELNVTFFKQRLKRPTIGLADTTNRLGQWDRGGRRLELSRSLLVRFGWGALVEVLKHEMAHQYADEVLGATDEAAHGATFREICRERGFDARAAGAPETAESSHRAPVLERIAKLLSLAESSNEHEAQAAMNAAQKLMLKHNIQEVTRGTAEACSFRHLGRATGRVSEAERLLANILSEHFFVDSIWVPVWRVDEGKRGSMLEICGRLENLVARGGPGPINTDDNALIEAVAGRIDFRQMLLDPSTECQDGFRHRAAQLGQAVFDLRRAGREDRSGHHAVSLETAQRPGQHLL